MKNKLGIWWLTRPVSQVKPEFRLYKGFCLLTFEESRSPESGDGRPRSVNLKCPFEGIVSKVLISAGTTINNGYLPLGKHSICFIISINVIHMFFNVIFPLCSLPLFYIFQGSDPWAEAMRPPHRYEGSVRRMRRRPSRVSQCFCWIIFIKMTLALVISSIAL